MVRTAARLWGVPEHEIDTNFDPLVLLMIDACAAELEKIGYDISASHSRLLDKLASLILPEAMIGPKPASCIVHATPVDAVAKIDGSTRFFTTQRANTQNGVQNTDMFFSPVGEFTLHKARLSWLLAGQKLYSIAPNGQRTLVSGADADNMRNIGEMWLIITPDKEVRTLEGLNIYFDLRSNSEAVAFYKSLDTAKGYIGDKQIGLQSGYYQPEQFEPDLHEMMVSGDDFTKKVTRHIAGVYQSHFVHISKEGASPEVIAGDMPEALRQQLPEKIVQQLAAQPMIYLRIEPGRVFPQEVLDAMLCTINAFPAVNRKMNVMNYRTDPWVNIVPVQVEGNFLDLHAITSVSGGGYKFRISSDAHGMDEGEALVRSSGIGKADSREVREIIGTLLEAIRDESAYFSEINNEFIQARLREISQILARLEDQVDRSRNNTSSGYQYILLRAKNPGEQLVINFWTTNGADANSIRSGTALMPFSHTLVAAKDAYTITNTIGGKSGLTETEKKNMLRQQLISKGRIVSAQDVKIQCVQLFGDKLQKVDVKKGVQVGAGAITGFTRTIDVQLTLTDEARNMTDEIAYLRSELEYILQANGSPVYPFRVVIV